MRIESWLDVTLTSTTNVTDNLLVAPATRTLTYDDDGNLTADGLWTYQWDGENRLKQVESAGTVPTAARRKLVLTYDHLGRRSTKKVYLWSGGDYSATPSVDLRSVYNAWNLVAELNATNNTPIRSYVWGQDLSGSLQGAGGIGGLLMVRDHGAGTYHFAGYDGNGNVTVLVNAANQALSAQDEYSPFGDLLRATGPLARSNPFRFSTKFADEETDLVYYGYRYYSPSLMRWISRDPIGERAGVNVYAFVLNQPMVLYDKDGRIIPILVAGASGALIGGVFGAVTDSGWYTGAIIGAISGISGGALLAMEVPAAVAGMLSGGIGSRLGVVAGGGNPFDGGAGSVSVAFGMGLGAAGGFLGTKFAEAIDESLALDIALGLASGSAEGAFSAYAGIATGIRGLGASIVGDHSGELQTE